MTNIGDAICSIRVARQLSTRGLAEIVGWSPAHVGAVENGDRVASHEFLEAVARKLELSDDDCQILGIVPPDLSAQLLNDPAVLPAIRAFLADFQTWRAGTGLRAFVFRWAAQMSAELLKKQRTKKSTAKK